MPVKPPRPIVAAFCFIPLPTAAGIESAAATGANSTLIDKIRAFVTEGPGLYRIVDLQLHHNQEIVLGAGGGTFAETVAPSARISRNSGNIFNRASAAHSRTTPTRCAKGGITHESSGAGSPGCSGGRETCANRALAWSAKVPWTSELPVLIRAQGGRR